MGLEPSSNPKPRLRAAAAAVLAALLAAACLVGAAGCSGNDAAAPSDASGPTVRIGTMPTEDILPLWVAEDEGMFATQGVDAEIVTFDSAPALSAAITAGQVDMAMTDVMRAVKLCESGTPVVLEWVTLGETAEQGRFGVMAPADSPYDSLAALAAGAARGEEAALRGVGVAANTVPEYAFDQLCISQGVDPASIPTQEVASLPERYSLMTTGQLAAAALPGSLLALGEANGMKLLADDAAGDNITQSVMVAQEAFAAEHQDAVVAVALAWNEAANAINANPEAYRALLAERANLNEAVADTYPVSTYPLAYDEGGLRRPTPAMVEPQVAWMVSKGYAAAPFAYDPATGTLVAAGA